MPEKKQPAVIRVSFTAEQLTAIDERIAEWNRAIGAAPVNRQMAVHILAMRGLELPAFRRGPSKRQRKHANNSGTVLPLVEREAS